MTVTLRRICWPGPGTSCLAGLCEHCNDYPLRNIRDIWYYAAKASGDHVTAYRYGKRSGWPEIEQCN
jgi:hypothetical protein